MENADFNPAETLAGFPLLSIKRALGFVGILDDRDDVALVAQALSCRRPQAAQVLAAAERRGLVRPTQVKNQWETTPLGWQLAMHWKPPARIEPAVALEDVPDSKAINEVFDDVPCSILRTTPDDAEAFEEARLEVGVFVDYASPRVIQISVSVPDDYDHPDSNATLDASVYIGIAEAKRFAGALQTAIARAEAELTRRTTLWPKRESTPPDGVTTPPDRRHGSKNAAVPKQAATRKKNQEAVTQTATRTKTSPVRKGAGRNGHAVAKPKGQREEQKLTKPRHARSKRP